MYEAWDRFKELQRMYPHHSLEKWVIVHTFYIALNYNTRMIVDVAINKRIDNTLILIEDMVLNHY